MYPNRQDEMVPNFVNENNIDINNTNYNMIESNPMAMSMPSQTMGMMTSPIIEPMRERVINRTIVHEVPQV